MMMLTDGDRVSNYFLSCGINYAMGIGHSAAVGAGQASYFLYCNHSLIVAEIDSLSCISRRDADRSDKRRSIFDLSCFRVFEHSRSADSILWFRFMRGFLSL